MVYKDTTTRGYLYESYNESHIFTNGIARKNQNRQKNPTSLLLNHGIFLSIKDKINFLQLARYSDKNEESFRNLFAKPFDFLLFNAILIQQHIKDTEVALAFDPSYINKSGKKTDGVGYFWSGVAGTVKWGLELGGLAVLSTQYHTAFHLDAIQTVDLAENETQMDFYTRQLLQRKTVLLDIAKHIVVDAYFSKSTFIQPMLYPPQMKTLEKA